MPLLAQTLWATYAGDIGVLAVCAVIFILLGTSYVVRTRSYRIFAAIIGLVFIAALMNIAYTTLLSFENPNLRYIIYAVRVLYQSLLFDMFFSFALYATVVSNMPKKRARTIATISMVLFIVIVATDVILSIVGVGFRIDAETGKIVNEPFVYTIGYAVYLIFLAILLFRIRKLVYKRVLWGFYATMLLAVGIRVTQMILKETVLTTFSFILPILAMFYIMHNNPYNVSTGTLDTKAMEDMIKNLYAKKKPFIIMSMLLPDFSGEGKSLPEVVRYQTRRFTIEYFRDGTLFQVGNGQIIMIARKDKNPDYVEWIKTILAAFTEQYQIHKMPYKIVYGESNDSLIKQNEYLSLIDRINNNIPNNTMHRIERMDIFYYREAGYIAEQLDDIFRKCDLNDPRVLVFCQPVFNIETQKFDTAEALMRLSFPETGRVNPMEFIPVAERLGYIHVLTKIILNKTCQAIRKFDEEGYSFKRISINVSSIELRDDHFCDDINEILQANGVPGDKIAIELTESQNEADFLIAKEKIEQLHAEGIKFYLDDFGTGYSNMERILELPFDIIKFDRSMVIASGQDQRSERIVENLAKMFNDFNYHVLYEGVETNTDEDRCLSMSATYLQGFKYSKPIPIEDLHNFFTRID